MKDSIGYVISDGTLNEVTQAVIVFGVEEGLKDAIEEFCKVTGTNPDSVCVNPIGLNEVK